MVIGGGVGRDIHVGGESVVPIVDLRAGSQSIGKLTVRQAADLIDTIGVLRVGVPGVHHAGVGHGHAVALLGVHGLHGAVGEDDQGLVHSLGQVSGAILIANHEEVVVVVGHILNAQQVAIGVQQQVVGELIHLLTVHVVVEEVLLVVVGLLRDVVLGAVSGDAGQAILRLHGAVGTVGGVGGHGHTGDDLGSIHGLNIAVRHGHHQEIILLIVGDLGEVIHFQTLGLSDQIARGGSASVDGGSQTAGALAVVIHGLSQIGMDLNNGGLLFVDVHIDLGQNTAARLAQIVVVAALQFGGLSGGLSVGVLHTIYPVGQVVVTGSGADVVIDLAALNAYGIGLAQQLLLSVGANLIAIITPGAGGTAKIVDGVIL